MLTQDEKLKAFLQAIDDYAERQRVRIVSELEESNRIAIEKAEKETLTQAAQLVTQHTAGVRVQISCDLASREAQSTRALIEKRTQIEDKVFARAAQKLLDFSHSNGYRDYMVRAAAKAAQKLPQGLSLQVRVKPEDMPLADLFQEFFPGCCVTEDSAIKLGGFRVEASDHGISVDATFDSAVEARREAFRETSGLRIK